MAKACRSVPSSGVAEAAGVDLEAFTLPAAQQVQAAQQANRSASPQNRTILPSATWYILQTDCAAVFPGESCR